MFGFIKKCKWVILRDGFLVVTPVLRTAQEATEWVAKNRGKELVTRYKIVQSRSLIADWGLENL